MTALPAPIQNFLDATNRGDAKGVVDSFTADAMLNDWGRQFDGHAGVASWDSTDNTGVRSRMEVLSFKPSANGTLVTIRVSGDGYNGTGNLDFSLSGDRISQLLIK